MVIKSDCRVYYVELYKSSERDITSDVFCTVIFVSGHVRAGLATPIRAHKTVSAWCCWRARDVGRMTVFKAIFHQQSSCGLELALASTWKLHNFRYISCQRGTTSFDSPCSSLHLLTWLSIGHRVHATRERWAHVPNGSESAVPCL